MKLLFSHEKQGGRLRGERGMEAFRAIFDACNLSNLGFLGHWYTWEHDRFSHTNIKECLGRGLATAAWQDMFPKSTVSHRVHSIFDYCSLLLDIGFAFKASLL
ncbi:hypothetical protein ES288_A13G143300v1 [Gossypium darwinii]|uniref:Uncharacterized protein n=1 Tax=Gossypium darwinii TaxID=34276 RepID=A0A5D2DZV5_GOSDA|nr:hypothetical protein ES288_A13G143300v1 [Gossypium darwinii]